MKYSLILSSGLLKKPNRISLKDNKNSGRVLQWITKESSIKKHCVWGQFQKNMISSFIGCITERAACTYMAYFFYQNDLAG